MKPIASRGRWPGCLFGILLLAAAVVLAGVYLWKYLDYAGPTRVTVSDPGKPMTDSAYVLSEQQAQVLAELGPPESFTILFYQEPGETLLEEIRFEVWRYHSAAREITFVNGETASDAALEVSGNPVDPTPFSPEQFGAYMGLKDLIGQTGIGAYVRGASEPELATGGELYFADRLAFALLHGRLVAVEALAIEAEG
jgi:hypothetical protein